ncbi:C-type lectin domain family 2 member A-like [Tachyglossus aculeatus]|uniref:C-type lectin domain family 2 member A-like n=1 Tax=Tachyglossus aculeatus TaxID=9261 RepID=UPI0018F784AD|nr:C-type lectin domain family 2 member A-like [Tachyglossus aculeatus]
MMTTQQMEILKNHMGSFTYWFGLNKERDSSWKWVDGSAFNSKFTIHGTGEFAYLDATGVKSDEWLVKKKWICSRPSKH